MSGFSEMLGKIPTKIKLGLGTGLLDPASNLSGYSNIYIACILGAMSALFLLLGAYDKLAEWKTRPSWITNRLIKIFLGLLFVAVILVVTFVVVRPIDSELGSPRIRVAQVMVAPRNPATDVPVYAQIDWIVDGDDPLIESAFTGTIFTFGSQVEEKDQDTNFKHLMALAMSFDGDLLKGAAIKTPFSVFAYARQPISDRDISEVLDGRRLIYIIGLWRYRIPHSSTVFVKEYCSFIEGSKQQLCPGKHNETYVAR